MWAPTHSRSGIGSSNGFSVSDVQPTHDWVVITHHGRTAAVVVPADDHARHEETVAILATPVLQMGLGVVEYVVAA